MTATLSPEEQGEARRLLDAGRPHALLIDRRVGTVEPLSRGAALDYAAGLLGPLPDAWAELRRPARWIAARFDAWAIVVEGQRVALVGIGRSAPAAN